MIKHIILAVVLGCFISTASAYDIPQPSPIAPSQISGQLDIAGLAQATITAGEFTVLDFQNPFVIAGTGDFAGIGFGTSVTMEDPWTVNPVTPGLWSVGGFMFDLDTITVNDGVTLTGYGTLSSTNANLLDTRGIWSFTKQFGEVRSSFSSTIIAVPAPLTIFLLGFGLLGLIATNRKANIA